MEIDPETERRVEEAKASMMAQAEELGRRFKDAKDKLDIAAKIEQHPRLAVGAAFAVGALLGLLQGGPRPHVIVRKVHTSDGSTSPEMKRSLLAAGAALLGSLVVQFAKDFAVRQLLDRAGLWIDERDPAQKAAAAARGSASDATLRH